MRRRSVIDELREALEILEEHFGSGMRPYGSEDGTRIFLTFYYDTPFQNQLGVMAFLEAHE